MTQLKVVDDGLAAGHSIELIDVTAALAELLAWLTGDANTVGEVLMYRLALSTLDLLGTAFSHTPEDRAIVTAWRQAYAEWKTNLQDARDE